VVNWSQSLQYAVLSDIGMRRANNQDSAAVALAIDEQAWATRGHLFVVADGMGAHAAGELASKLAVDNIPLIYDKLRHLPPPTALSQAIHETNALIHARGQGDVEFQGMGTTCSTLVLLPQGALVAHVGDSRVYRLRGDTLDQLTFDHSLQWEMMKAGQFSESDIPGYIPKNVITRSLGPQPEVKVDLEGPLPIEPGDKYLLCSDGLTGQVTDTQLGAILKCFPPQYAAQTLIDLANLRGGPDNITVIVAEVLGPQLAQSGAAEPIERRPLASARETPWSWWLATAVLSIAAIVFGLVGWWIFAGASLAAAVLAGGMLMRFYSASSELPDDLPLGEGPYRTAKAVADAAFVADLADLAEQLRQLSDEERWPLDQRPLEEKLRAAHTAASRNDCPESVTLYGDAIRLAMQQFRDRRGRPPSGADDRAT
jgi:protein phosphatase